MPSAAGGGRTWRCAGAPAATGGRRVAQAQAAPAAWRQRPARHATTGAVTALGSARLAHCRHRAGRVEQHRELARSADRTGPTDIEHARSRKGSCTARSLIDAQHRPAIGLTHQLHLRAGKHRVVVQALGAERIGRRHAHAQRGRLLGVRLVSSISALRVSPSADCTLQATQAPAHGPNGRPAGRARPRRPGSTKEGVGAVRPKVAGWFKASPIAGR